MLTSHASKINTLTENIFCTLNQDVVPHPLPHPTKYGDVRLKHQIMKDAIKNYAYPKIIKDILSELVNLSNGVGQSRASQRKIGERVGRTDRTVRTFLARLQNDGLIEKKKNGWQKTDTITLLPIYELHHKAEKISADLNNLNLRDRDLNNNNCRVDVDLVNQYEKEMSMPEKFENRPIRVAELNEDVAKDWSGMPAQIKTEKKTGIIEKFYEMGLTLKGVKIFLALIKTLKISNHIVYRAIESTKAASNVKNMGGYFRTVLVALHNDYISPKPKPTGDINVSKKSFTSGFTNIELEESYSERATRYLEAKGIPYPLRADFDSNIAHYDALNEYGSRHASLVAHFKQQPSQVVVIPAKPPVVEQEDRYHWMD